MKKRLALFAVCAAVILIFSACGELEEITPPAAENLVTTEAATDSDDYFFDKKSDDFNADLIEETQLTLDDSWKVIRHGDGYLVLQEVCVNDFGLDGYFRITKYDSEGNLLWVQDYEYAYSGYSLSDVTETSDGGYALMFSRCNVQVEPANYTALIKCDRNGKEVSRHEFDYTATFSYVFETAKGEFFLIGDTYSQDCIIVKYNFTTKKELYLSNSGLGAEYVVDAVYSPATGLAVLTKSYYSYTGSGERIVLEEPDDWIHIWGDDFDFKGVHSWGTSCDFFKVTVQDGKIKVIRKVNRTKEIQATEIIEIDVAESCGNARNTKVIPNTNNTKIYLTDDGGYFSVKTLFIENRTPNEYISAVLWDTATQLERYDRDGNLMYRKTYDRRTETYVYDNIIVFSDGKVVADKVIK